LTCLAARGRLSRSCSSLSQSLRLNITPATCRGFSVALTSSMLSACFQQFQYPIAGSIGGRLGHTNTQGGRHWDSHSQALSFAPQAIAIMPTVLSSGCSAHCGPNSLKSLPPAPIPIHEVEAVTRNGRSIRVFRVGSIGPPLIVLHEVTGLSPQTSRLSQILAREGFSVSICPCFSENQVIHDSS
jgi:hypothetical protein